MNSGVPGVLDWRMMEIRIDIVHDIQKAYRKLLDSMSRPGLINNINEQAEKIDLEVRCAKPAIIMALMLLDTEVTFKVVGQYESETSGLINQLTYANSVETEKADFIFIMKDAYKQEIRRVLESAGIGDLMNPHRSATIIIESAAVSNDYTLLLSGPGIEDGIGINVDGPVEWLAIREEKNHEYPLGIDMIFYDTSGKILCIPRTTQISRYKEQVIE